MKTVRFKFSVAGDKYQFGRGWVGPVEDWIANSEIAAGNAELVITDVPNGLQEPAKPKRKPEIDFPEVHTTVIKKSGPQPADKSNDDIAAIIKPKRPVSKVAKKPAKSQPKKTGKSKK